MPDRHKHPPLFFRPAGDDREWLAAHVAETGKKQGRILAEALTAYRAAVDGQTTAVLEERAMKPVVRPRKRSEPATPDWSPPRRCTHPGKRVIGGYCPQCDAVVQPGGDIR